MLASLLGLMSLGVVSLTQVAAAGPIRSGTAETSVTLEPSGGPRPSASQPRTETRNDRPPRSPDSAVAADQSGPEYFSWSAEGRQELEPGILDPQTIRRLTRAPGLEFEYTVNGNEVSEQFVPRPPGQSCGFSRPGANPFRAGVDVAKKMFERHELRLSPEKAAELAQRFVEITATDGFQRRGEELKGGTAPLGPGEFSIETDGSIVFGPGTKSFSIEAMGSGGAKPGTKPRLCIDPTIAPRERVYGTLIESADGTAWVFALYPCKNPGGITPEPGLPPTPDTPDARPLSSPSSLSNLFLGLGMLGLSFLFAPLNHGSSGRKRKVAAEEHAGS